MMRQAPLGHDRAAPGNNAGNAIGCKRDVLQAYACMDGEVVDTLLRLFDERISKNFPGQVFRVAIDFFQCLINGHGTNGHGRIPQNPFTGFVDVFASGKIHQGIATPAGRPDHFFYFFFNRRSDSRVADIGVYLNQEVSADNHRFQFRVIGVGWDNGATLGNFIAHEFRCDFIRNIGAKRISWMLLQEFRVARIFLDLLQSHVFPDSDVFHLRCNYTFACVVHLGHVLAREGTAGIPDMLKAKMGEFRTILSFPSKLGAWAVEQLGIGAVLDPLVTNRRKPFK